MSKKKHKRARHIVIAIVLLVAAAAVAAAVLRPRKADYTMVTAKKGNITTYYSFSGSVEAKNSRTVYASQSMQIDKIRYSEDKTVKKNAVILESTTGDKVKAPIAGTLSEIDVDKDELAMSGSKLFQIVDYKHLQLTVQVDEYDLSSVKTGKSAKVTIHALGKNVTGKITKIAKEGVYANGVTYFDTTISLPQNSSLRVGMSAEAKVLDKSVKNVVVLPENVIQFNTDNTAYVQVLDEKGNLKKVAVKIGISDGTHVEVKSGIALGQSVVKPESTDNTAMFGTSSGMRTGASGSTVSVYRSDASSD